jgi:hypothetical protein
MSQQSTGFGREERRGGGGAVDASGLDGLDCVRSLKETARRLDLSMSTLRRRIDDGAIKVVRLSQRRVGVTDRAREAFLKENAT